MRQRVFLFLFGLLAISWISYVSFGLLSNENRQNFRSYFQEKDQKVWIIHQAAEFNWDQEGVQTTAFNQNLYNTVLRRMNEPVHLFFSAKRTLFLIEKKSNWTKYEVRQLLENGLFAFQLGQLKQFEYGKLHGQYNANQLLIYEGELGTAGTPFEIDEKASFTTLTWKKDTGLHQVDTYVKADMIYRYEKFKNKKQQLKKADDRAVFSDFIPSFINGYAFYEKSYFAQCDPSFQKSTWMRCVKTGVVIIEKDSAKAAIFDFSENANPIQSLNESLRKSEDNEDFASFDGLYFSSFLETKPSTLYIGTVDGFAVVSSSSSLVDNVIAEASLGNTISQDEAFCKRLYANMPQKVSARWVNPTIKSTLTLLGKQVVITTYQKQNQLDDANLEKVREYFVMNPGQRVIDFAAFDERGNVIALTSENKLVGYQNGLRKWDKQLQTEVKRLYLVDGQQQLVCAQFAHEAQLYDRSGRLIYKLSQESSTDIQVFQSKGNVFFACQTDDQHIQIINNAGKNVKTISCNQHIQAQLAGLQGKKPQLSILTDAQVIFVELSTYKISAKQNADSTYHLSKSKSGLYAISVKNGKATVLKNGKSSNFSVPSAVQFVSSYSTAQTTMHLFKRGKELYAYTEEGVKNWELSLPAQEISMVSIESAKNGSTLLCFLDALDNQIYLLDDLGRKLDDTDREGEAKVQVSAFGGNAFSITSFLGSYLIQYTKQ
ncbi:MAG: hypothetical protein RLZZ301_682 [Bacteroidota bacterium]|jgi:hypothetical protein